VAVDRYDELWRRFPRGPLRDDAAYQAALLLRKDGRFQEAAERLSRLEQTFHKAIIVGHYNTLLLDDGALLLGRIYLDDLHRPDDAIRALKGLLKRQPESLLCDDALYLMAQAALSRHDPASPSPKDRAEACDDLQQLHKRYPDGNMVRKGAQEQARLGCR
jgi:TolA-binding protein